MWRWGFNPADGVTKLLSISSSLPPFGTAGTVSADENDIARFVGRSIRTATELYQ
jgi:hypothetical protein